jgi:glycosyltransferase involved in cell wall biosynthesis
MVYPKSISFTSFLAKRSNNETSQPVLQTEKDLLTEVNTAEVALGRAETQVNGEKTHVALFVPSLASGGAERVTLHIAEGLVALGAQVDLVLSSQTGDYVRQVPEGVRVVDLGSRRVLTSLPKLARYLRRERPAVMLSALAHSNLVALWARAISMTDTKIVVAVHSTLSRSTKYSPRRRDRLVPWLTHLFYRKAAHVVAVSHGAADDLIRSTRIDPKLVEVIPNPVISDRLFDKANESVDHEWLTDHDRPVLISVGRLTVAKNYGLLLRALKHVRGSMDAKLIILGDGEERQKLEAIVQELDLGDHVYMPGFVDNPYAYMSRSDVFVLSSSFEGLPTVLVEALAIGLKVVSTDCEFGPRELLRDGRLGRLVEPDNPERLAAGILEAIDAAPTKIGRADLEAFEMESAVNRYKELLINGAR